MHLVSMPSRGLTENAGHENDRPSKLQDMKLQDMKLSDHAIFAVFARHEIAARENEGPICRA